MERLQGYFVLELWEARLCLSSLVASGTHLGLRIGMTFLYLDLCLRAERWLLGQAPHQ